MRIGFARMVHKSNSFARASTSFETFHNHELLNGDEVRNAYRGTGTVTGGVIAAASEQQMDLAPLLATSAPAGGPVDPGCVATLCEQLNAALRTARSSSDAIILELSGAMTTTDGRSADRQILDSLKQAQPQLPVVLVLSSQANASSDFVSKADAIVTPRSIPDDDPAVTGARALAIANRLANGEQLRMYCTHLPMLIPIPAQRTSEEPLRSLFQLAREREASAGIESIEILAGYPFADTPDTGTTVVVTGQSEQIQRVCEEIAESMWNHRHHLFVKGRNVEEAVHHAMASRQGPVLIADLGDNPDDGAPGDGTTVLWALMDLGVRNATVGAIADEQAVEACFRAGIGSRVEIPVGGRKDTRHGYPIDINAKVVSLHEGCITWHGPVNRGVRVDPGRMVVVDVEARHDGHVELILSENAVQITDTALFEHVGVDITDRAILSIKSANDYRPAFLNIASAVFEVITPGITTPDPEFFAFERIQRPIFPLDRVE